MTTPITQVATTDIAEMMQPSSGLRMPLPGFGPEFVDFPHYIIHITEVIWHHRQVDKCLEWYTPDCVIHTLAGDVVGAQTVVDNTWATLAAFPDRRLDADNVIWSQEGEGAFYSSHLITSKMTNQGPSDFGPATGRKVRVRTIADCLCADNRIGREWLVRDNLGLVLQLGFDPGSVAARQAAADQAKGFDLPAFLARQAVSDEVEPQTPAQVRACAALAQVWRGRDLTQLPRLYDYRVRALMPGGLDLYGPDEISDWLGPLLEALPDAELTIEHLAEIPYLGAARDVAIRWRVRGTHAGPGRYGTPTGAPVEILAVTHARVIGDRIREETTVFDDLAVFRQIAAHRLKGG